MTATLELIEVSWATLDESVQCDQAFGDVPCPMPAEWRAHVSCCNTSLPICAAHHLWITTHPCYPTLMFHARAHSRKPHAVPSITWSKL